MSGSKLLNDPSRGAPADKAELQHPLALTVHDMPAPEQVMAQEARRTAAGRWKMMAVLLICAAPVLASYFTYYVLRPQAAGRNFGELIDPQRPLPDITATTLDGKKVPLHTLKGQWLLLSAGSGHCGEACVQQLYLQRQLRESLGKDKDRLDRVWLVTDEEAIPNELLPGLSQATVLRVPRAELERWLTPAPGRQLPDHLYLIDPLGNWMMRLPPDLDIPRASKAKRDLERLMRASASWDQPGR